MYITLTIKYKIKTSKIKFKELVREEYVVVK